MRETPTQTVKRFVENDIQGVKNIIVISEMKDGNIVVTHNDLDWRDLMFALNVARDSAFIEFRRDNGNG